MKRTAIVLAGIVWSWSILVAQTSAVEHNALEIRIANRAVGHVQSVRIENKGGSRISIHIDANFESFAKQLDEILQEKGNLGGCQQRFFWRGNTSLRGGGEELEMSSRIAYEAWTCPRPIRLPGGGRIPIPRARVFGDVKNVAWTLFIQPAPIDRLYVSARVDNIAGWPDWMERAFGLRITEHIAIEIPDSCGACPCLQFVESVRPRFESVNFELERGGTLQVSVVLSVARNVLTEVLRCRLPGDN